LALDPLTHHLWVGTSDGIFSEPAWNCRREVNALALAFSPAPAGTLWIGTPTGLEVWPAPGADKALVGQPPHHFTAVASGLAADKVTALAIRIVAGQEEIWIGTPNGVSRYQVTA
jgi:ligand-binding sensor domain-containing protein